MNWLHRGKFTWIGGLYTVRRVTGKSGDFTHAYEALRDGKSLGKFHGYASEARQACERDEAVTSMQMRADESGGEVVL